MGSSSPIFGVKIKNVWNHQPALNPWNCLRLEIAYGLLNFNYQGTLHQAWSQNPWPAERNDVNPCGFSEEKCPSHQGEASDFVLLMLQKSGLHSPVEVGSCLFIYHSLQGFSTIQTVVVWDFWTINSSTLIIHFQTEGVVRGGGSRAKWRKCSLSKISQVV